MDQDHQEMQLLSSHPHPSPWAGPSLDLQLSISVAGPFKPPSAASVRSSVEALKWEAAEQIRLAAMEKAYAEHMMELTRREMEVAQSEFLRARSLWERAREEVERAERMRERAAATATATATSACMEITCLSCRHKFRP
ncbi:zinc finger protein SHOOT GRAVITROPISM 5-like [Salvia miltiorrhiza]|uniref:zinc finger protein SHOOT GRAVITROPISM 5-like n=1 Tax=Salvia miltiorrhiza TaxID=226208 RepID=UPI0025AD048C|nr:zinc finger protein SHOOT GRAVITROPISM 5-like [Salvia miltiorrhiza]